MSQSLVSHLIELRKRLMLSIMWVMLCFLGLVYFANDIYHLLASPLMQNLPSNGSMIATGVATPFLTPIKLTLFCALALAVPILLYQAWCFIKPGLKTQERHFLAPLILSGSLLFYLGIAFAYAVVLPAAFAFLSTSAPQGVVIATDISTYLDFVLALFLAFGLAFEIPIVVLLVCKTELSDVETLSRSRPYVIVASFVIGMLLTPPDIISQTLLAIPMCLLFELGLMASRLMLKTSTEPRLKTVSD